MASDRLFGHERKVHLHDGGWFKLPASHVEADKIILSGLTALAASHAVRSFLDVRAGELNLLNLVLVALHAQSTNSKSLRLLSRIQRENVCA